MKPKYHGYQSPYDCGGFWRWFFRCWHYSDPRVTELGIWMFGCYLIFQWRTP